MSIGRAVLRRKRSQFHTSRDKKSVFYDESPDTLGWAVRWKGEVLSPRWLSAGAAQAHLDGLRRKETAT